MFREFVSVTLAASIMMVADAYQKPTMRVEKFTSNGECKISDAQIENLQTRIVGNLRDSLKYEVVEREHLAKIQSELKLVDAGMTEGNAPESNRLKAAGYCVYGKILQFRSDEHNVKSGDGVKFSYAIGTVEVQLRVADITTGQILATLTVKSVASSEKIPANVQTTKDIQGEALTQAVEDVAQKVVIKLNVITFPVSIVSVKDQFVVGNVTEAQARRGDVWEVYTLGNVLKDPQTGEELGFDEELIANVRVSLPDSRMTKFEYGLDEADFEKAKKAITAAWKKKDRMIMRMSQFKSVPQGKTKAPLRRLR